MYIYIIYIYMYIIYMYTCDKHIQIHNMYNMMPMFIIHARILPI